MLNVISAIFSCSRQEGCFTGDNPVSLLRPPELHRKRPNALTLAQAKEAFGAMRYPEREITLLSVFTGMSMVEILGLQWKQVSLSEIEVNIDRKIRPRTIVVTNQLYRGTSPTAP